MKVFRFMSLKELKKYLNEEELINRTKHKAKTSSVGFCFMAEKDVSPKDAYDFLLGVVSNELCAEFEVDKNKLNESYGVYADPYGPSFFSSQIVTEYCTEKYSKKDFKLLRIADIEFNNEEREFVFNWHKDINAGIKKINKKIEERNKREKLKKEKDRATEEFEKEQKLKLQDFLKEIEKEHKIDIRIGNKYYKIPADILRLSGKPITVDVPNIDINGVSYYIPGRANIEIDLALCFK